MPTFCDDCICKVQELFPQLKKAVVSADHAQDNQEEDNPYYQDDSPPVKKLRIDVTSLTTSERLQLAYDLGSVESRDAKLSALELSKYRDLDSLLALDCTQSPANKTILAFLSGLSGTPASGPECSSQHQEYTNKLYQLYKCVESVMHQTGRNLSLPAHFREAVLIYTLTGSKLALKILGSGGPHVSYNSVKSWLSGLAAVPATIPSGDFIAAFDNNQVLQRRWKVKLRNEVKCNIVMLWYS